MGQQPNIPLGIEDLPRSTPKPGPPRRWSPNRPGDLAAPEEVPWGGAFGTPGPDTGYALVLLRKRHLDLLPGESRRDAEAALAAVMAARGSRLGRAPMAADADAAEIILGFGSVDPSRRRPWTAGLAHDPARVRQLVAAVDSEALVASVEDLRDRARRGERMFAARS